MPVKIQQHDFDLSSEITALRAGNAQVGAVVAFVGTVRDINEGAGVATLELEHYPEMTLRTLNEIVAQAKARWEIMDALVIHRFGLLHPCDQIVLVAVISAHRSEAFCACEFLMDYLKTQAPFWKKETTPEGARWVEARTSDDISARRWEN